MLRNPPERKARKRYAQFLTNMTQKDLIILDELLKRTEDLPSILHLRAAEVGYVLTEDDKKLLFDTYQKLDDILLFSNCFELYLLTRSALLN